jgi:enediyne biosynthesis protein E3
MIGWLRSIRRRVLGIRPEAVSFARLGFSGGTTAARERLSAIPHVFVLGYHAALDDDRMECLVPRLEAITRDDRGFAFEGAAMGLALLDWFTPWKRHRIRGFLQGAGGAHSYMVHVGIGWAMARVHENPETVKSRSHPLLCWLAIDGYGFHEGFFHWSRYHAGQPLPRLFDGYNGRAFDQGLGRSLWFIHCADVTRIAETISGFPEKRRSDLWSGIGLAATYAGGVGESELRSLCTCCSNCLPSMAQGAAFAAKARHRAGLISPYTELACGVLCQCSATEAARLTDVALENLSADGQEPAYEVWRQRVQRAWKDESFGAKRGPGRGNSNSPMA